MTTSHPFLSHPINIQRREPYLFDFVNVSLYSDIYLFISFICGLIIQLETTLLYILVWMTLACIEDHSSMRNDNFGVYFLSNFATEFDEIQYVAKTCWFVEAHAKYRLHKYSKERTLLM